MPFRSKAQRRKFYAMKARGQMSQKKIDEWESHTKKKGLPERVRKHAYYLGCAAALEKIGMSAESFEDFAQNDDTEAGDDAGEDEEAEIGALEANNDKLINPPSPWTGAQLVSENKSSDI